MNYNKIMLIKIIRVMGPKLTLPEDFKDHDFLKIMRKWHM